MIRRLAFVPFTRPQDRAGRLVRLSLAMIALILLAVWNPSLRPGPVLCLMRRAIALPCPYCGVTRGVALTLRGQPIEATDYNPLSVPVLVVGLTLMTLWAIEYARDRRLLITLTPLGYTVVTLILLALTAFAWHQVLQRPREDDFSSSWLAWMGRVFW